MANTHRYLLLLYFRVALFTVLCFGMLTLMLPKIIASANNSTWNNNAVTTCANVTKTHTVQFYYTDTDPSYSHSEPYYDGYVIVAYLNYSYEFRKYSWYSNHTQLKSDLKECCTIGMCINIYYDKNNPADANSSLLSTYTFPSWIAGLVTGLLAVFGCLYFSYRYDHRYYSELISLNSLRRVSVEEDEETVDPRKSKDLYSSGLLYSS